MTTHHGQHPGRPARRPSFLLTTAALLGAACQPAGHQHTQAADPAHDDPHPVVVTLFTDEAGLFVEYPQLEPGAPADFLAHVTLLADGAPVRAGSAALVVTDPTGTELRIEVPAPKRDGLFVPTWTPRTPGVHAARLEVAGPRLATSFHLPDLVVHADHASAHAAGMQDEEPVDAVPFLLEAQWEVGLRTELVERHVLSERLAVVGTFGAPSGSLAVAGSSVSGRIEAPLSGPLPGLGQTVEAGQVLARVAQALDHADHAAARANELAEQALALSAETFRSELQLRDLDLGLRALEAEQALVEARTERAFAERALERARDLRAKELETAAGLEQAELAVRRAVQAEAAALALGERTDALRSDLASLVSLARNPAEEAHGPDKDLHDVVAPIAGELIEVRAVLGEEVDQGAGLFRVLDPRRLWLTLQVSEFDLHRLGANPGPAEPPRLHLELPGRPGERLDVLTELGGHLVQVGRTVDPVSRTVALTYELDNPDGAFRLGALADGSLETVHRRDAVAVPEQAVVLDGGREVVFVVLDGETFVRREVQLGIRDGGLVEVLSGVEPGDRVVVDGAYLVKLAAASPDTFGDGHAH